MNEFSVKTVEQLVDAHGVQAVLQVLAAVCTEKAQHITETWQDAALAGVWADAATAVDAVTQEQAIVRLSAVEGRERS